MPGEHVAVFNDEALEKMSYQQPATPVSNASHHTRSISPTTASDSIVSQHNGYSSKFDDPISTTHASSASLPPRSASPMTSPDGAPVNGYGTNRFEEGTEQFAFKQPLPPNGPVPAQQQRPVSPLDGGSDNLSQHNMQQQQQSQHGPEIQTIELHKSNNGMGLCIVATKGLGQDRLGIYIKTVVKGGAADMVSKLN